MRPSRVLYVATGAGIVATSHGDFPGDGGFLLFVTAILCLGAVVFDWINA